MVIPPTDRFSKGVLRLYRSVAEKAVKGWMGKVGTFPQHLPSSLFLRGEGAAFQKKAPRKEGGGLAGEDQAGGF